MSADLFGAEVCYPPDDLCPWYDEWAEWAEDMEMVDRAAWADDRWNEVSYD